MNHQPARQRFPGCIARSDTESFASNKEYCSSICWKSVPRVYLAHHCLNHSFGHGFDHWYSAGCRCAHTPSPCAVLRLRARTTASTGPLVGYSRRPGGVKRALVFFTSGIRHWSDYWVDHWFNHRSAVACQRAQTASPFALMRFWARTIGSTYSWHLGGICCVFVFLRPMFGCGGCDLRWRAAPV